MLKVGISAYAACAALFVAGAAPGQIESRIAGTVAVERNGRIEPLAKAFVSVHSSSGGIWATTRTNSSGGYAFVNLPADRVALTASKAGFLTLSAGGRSGSKLSVDCTNGCSAPDADFVLSPGATLDGAVRDGFGKPLPRAAVEIRSDSSDFTAEKSTDDLGRFRFAGLPAGAYVVTIQGPRTTQRAESVSRTVALEAGQPLENLLFTLGALENRRVTGTVSGVPMGDGYRTWVQMSSANGSARPLYADVRPDGSFEFEAVPEGRYQAAAGAAVIGAGERTDYLLDAVEIRSNVSGLSLSPIEPSSISGVIEVAAGNLPANAAVTLTPNDGTGYRWFRGAPSGREFSLDRMRPGSYRLEPRSKGFYVKGVKRGGDAIEPASNVVLRPGANPLTVVLAADHSAVSGTIRTPEGTAPLPYARVALQGKLGDLSVRTDQNGRFQFGEVIPGEYRICAWADLDPESLADEAVWEGADCESRYIRIDPSSEVEIDLRAAP